jgi:hexosaminidase
MNRKHLLVKLLLTSLPVLLLPAACREKVPESELVINIVPQPAVVAPQEGYFRLGKNTAIAIGSEEPKLREVADYLAGHLSRATGYDLKVREETREKGAKSTIFLSVDPRIGGEEAYVLQSGPGGLTITGGSPKGVFYGVQTLRQLLPADIESPVPVERKNWLVPGVRIEDAPRFSYRGLHLDVGRHFFPVPVIKKYLDLMAYHKINTFHWHLTEDQGWRIEIRKFPKLAEVAAFRNETLVGHGARPPFEYDGQRYGGFYTQDEVREVVAYAASLNIDVMPEIEMPGHAQAALAAYPELGCTGGPYEVVTRWGVFDEVFCAGNEEVFAFLEGVLDEVVELFPYKYVHIGGDECPKTRWEKCPKCQARKRQEGLKDEHELQSYFIQRVEKYLLTKNRSIIGWDEILEGGLAPQATVMSWRGISGGIEAARQRHDVVMTPTTHMYLDYYQFDPDTEPLAIGGFLNLEKVYSFEPVPAELNEEEARHILGVQANVWTEYIKTPEHLEYMVYPRACALAEVAWTTAGQRNWDDFKLRMMLHYDRLRALGVNFCDLEERSMRMGPRTM